MRLSRRVPQHYQFQLRTSRSARVANNKKKFWERGPQEALDHAKELLGIKHNVTPRSFKKAGGVFLKMVFGEDVSPCKNRTIFPFS